MDTVPWEVKIKNKYLISLDSVLIFSEGDVHILNVIHTLAISIHLISSRATEIDYLNYSPAFIPIIMIIITVILLKTITITLKIKNKWRRYKLYLSSNFLSLPVQHPTPTYNIRGYISSYNFSFFA